MNPNNSNTNDFKVVSFHNNTDFVFTADMGCMYDSRPINGRTGMGIDVGETMTLPYHIGHQLALNLAKVALIRVAPAVDKAGIPTGEPLWSDTKLETLKNSFLAELYSEQKPIAVSETDKLMAKVEEYKKMVDSLISSKEEDKAPEVETESTPKTFLDKQEVIAELEKRGIKHDKRLSKDILEKLIV